MAFSFDELADETAQTTVKASGSSAVRVGIVNQADIPDIVAELFPLSTSFGTTNLVGIGAAHPDFPWLRVDELHFRPLTNRITGPDTDPMSGLTPEFAGGMKLTIKYVTPKFSIEEKTDDPVPYLNHRWAIGGEFITIPAQKLNWRSAFSGSRATSEDVHAGVFIPTIEHQITWPNVAAPPFIAIRSCIGRVNQDLLTFETGDIWPETLLLLGVEIERQVMTDGSRSWQLSYRASERAVISSDPEDAPDTEGSVQTPGNPIGGWNHFWRPEAGGFYRLTRPSKSVTQDVFDAAPAWMLPFRVGDPGDYSYSVTPPIFYPADFLSLFQSANSN